MKRKMVARYEADLSRAVSENKPRMMVKHYEELIDRYLNELN